MTDYANFTDDDVPPEAPHTADHLAPCHAFDAAGTATQPTRLVLASFADVDADMADGEWLSIDADHVREVEP